MYLGCFFNKFRTNFPPSKKFSWQPSTFSPVLQIWIRRVRMFSGLLDLDPDQLVPYEARIRIRLQILLHYHQAKIVRKTLIPTVL
jgi:hypothetical protein